MLNSNKGIEKLNSYSMKNNNFLSPPSPNVNLTNNNLNETFAKYSLNLSTPQSHFSSESEILAEANSKHFAQSNGKFVPLSPKITSLPGNMIEDSESNNRILKKHDYAVYFEEIMKKIFGDTYSSSDSNASANFTMKNMTTPILNCEEPKLTSVMTENIDFRNQSNQKNNKSEFYNHFQGNFNTKLENDLNYPIYNHLQNLHTGPNGVNGINDPNILYQLLQSAYNPSIKNYTESLQNIFNGVKEEFFEIMSHTLDSLFTKYFKYFFEEQQQTYYKQLINSKGNNNSYHQSYTLHGLTEPTLYEQSGEANRTNDYFNKSSLYRPYLNERNISSQKLHFEYKKGSKNLFHQDVPITSTSSSPTYATCFSNTDKEKMDFFKNRMKDIYFDNIKSCEENLEKKCGTKLDEKIEDQSSENSLDTEEEQFDECDGSDNNDQNDFDSHDKIEENCVITTQKEIPNQTKRNLDQSEGSPKTHQDNEGDDVAVQVESECNNHNNAISTPLFGTIKREILDSYFHKTNKLKKQKITDTRLPIKSVKASFEAADELERELSDTSPMSYNATANLSFNNAHLKQRFNEENNILEMNMVEKYAMLNPFYKKWLLGRKKFMWSQDEFVDDLNAQCWDKNERTNLTPLHLRKAKLMFFYIRYPNSNTLKAAYTDIKFNRSNTAQLVKWFSNFREFFYLNMEKYARKSINEGVTRSQDFSVNEDSDLYKTLVMHYNRNFHIQVPENFKTVCQETFKNFFEAIQSGKDKEHSWKKVIYKVIARLDDKIPDFFASDSFLKQLES